MSSNEDRARKLADAFRAEHGLGLGPIKDVFELVHVFAGVDVMSMEASEAEHGLSMMDPASGRVVVAVATTVHPMRQRSSVAHELGHVLAGDLEHPERLAPGERTPEEIRADAFARHLLLPVQAVRTRLGHLTGGVSDAMLSVLVQEYEVSPHLVAIQMKEAGFINPATCREWSELSTATLAARYGWLSQYRTLVGASAAPRAPQALMTRAVEGYRQGVLGITELAQWYAQSADELCEELGVPQQVEEDIPDRWDTDAPLFPDDVEDGAP